MSLTQAESTLSQSEAEIERSCDPTVGFGRAFDEAWTSLMDKRVGIVGIRGAAGVGKTTVLTQIKNKFLSLASDFYFVIWVTVGRRLRLEKIQEDIGNEIGFSGEQWKIKRLDERAKDIFNVLSKRKFVLLLDDVSENIDLVKVGVPSLIKPNGSKIAFTTCFLHLRGKMQADEMVEVRALSQLEAFKLFRKRIGEHVVRGGQTIFHLAEAVASKCGGFPLPLMITAHAMSCKKNPLDWYHALEVINRCQSALSLSGESDDMISVLKFAYDSLISYKIRYCLLYCTLFPEKFKVLKDDLIDYWICEELLDEHGSRDRNEKLGYNIIDTLVSAGLLEEEDRYIKMHSLVRDVALHIANRDFFVKVSAELTEMPHTIFLEGVQRISLMENSIRYLIEVPKCLKLSTLFLCHNPLNMISGDFFLYMGAVKVLDLSNSNIEEFPLGISKLVSLQYLNLSHTCIEQLPLELKMLQKLKYLNLEHNELLRVIPRQVISSLSSLQVLRMFHCGFSLLEDEDNILSDSNIHVDELQCLKQLSVLSITITIAAAFESFCKSDRLPSCTCALSLECLWGSKSVNISLLAPMKHLNILEIYRTDHLEELNVDFMMEETEIQDLGGLYDSGPLRNRSFNSLKEVSVGKCLRLRDLTWLTLAPNLVVLRVTVCEEMEEIISIGELDKSLNGDRNLIPFTKLEVLVLESLPKLKSIYKNDVPFPSLNKIKVLDCPLLKKLPLNSSSVKGSAVIIQAQEHWWKDVEWEDDATKTALLPRFIPIQD